MIQKQNCLSAYDHTRDKIVRLLKESLEPISISLTGAWGIGKSYLWQEFIVPEVQKTRRVYTISLFGIESLTDIRNQVLAFSELEESLEDVVICLDDVERHSNKIELKDIFGYVTYLRDYEKANIVLIYNSEEMGEDLANYLDKTVQYFFRLVASKTELLDLVFSEFFYERFKEDMLKLDVYNLRVLSRLNSHLKEVERVFHDRHKDKEIALRSCLTSFVYYTQNGNLSYHLLRSFLEGKDLGIIVSGEEYYRELQNLFEGQKLDETAVNNILNKCIFDSNRFQTYFNLESLKEQLFYTLKPQKSQLAEKYLSELSQNFELLDIGNQYNHLLTIERFCDSEESSLYDFDNRKIKNLIIKFQENYKSSNETLSVGYLPNTSKLNFLIQEENARKKSKVQITAKNFSDFFLDPDGYHELADQLAMLPLEEFKDHLMQLHLNSLKSYLKRRGGVYFSFNKKLWQTLEILFQEDEMCRILKREMIEYESAKEDLLGWT